MVQFLIETIIHWFQSQNSPLFESYSQPFSNNIIFYSLKYTEKFINLDDMFFYTRALLFELFCDIVSNSLYYCHAEIKNIKTVSWNKVKINTKNNLYHQVQCTYPVNNIRSVKMKCNNYETTKVCHHIDESVTASISIYSSIYSSAFVTFFRKMLIFDVEIHDSNL